MRIYFIFRGKIIYAASVRRTERIIILSALFVIHMIQILPNVEILRKNLFKMLDKQFFCVYNV